jgi:hypothetical protein
MSTTGFSLWFLVLRGNDRSSRSHLALDVFSGRPVSLMKTWLLALLYLGELYKRKWTCKRGRVIFDVRVRG